MANADSNTVSALLNIGLGAGALGVFPLESTGAAWLAQPYQNPASGPVTLRFGLPGANRVSLGIYDVMGRLIRMELDQTLPAGVHSVGWDARDNRGSPVPAGVYYYELRAGARRLQKPVVILR